MKIMHFAACTAAAMALATGAHATQLLTNGDFETGDLSGWTVVDQAGGSGSVYIALNGGGSPLNGFSTPTLAGGGTYNAQTDQFGPGSHQLEQSFTAVAGRTYVISFDRFGNDYSGASPVGTGLDYTNVPNQHVEFNLYGPISTNVYTGDIFPGNTWGNITYDLSSFITVSGVYTISFGEVDNQNFYNIGLDNISLVETGVPEPDAWALMLLGFAGAGAMLRFRRSLTAA